jgi:predicted DNA-binding protein
MRRKKVVSVSLPDYAYASLEELSMRTGWSKSKIVEMAIVKFVSEMLKALKREKEGKMSQEDEEKLREEYWRKVYLGEIPADWVSVW